MALSQYLPKNMESHLKLQESLKPSLESEKVVPCAKDNQDVPKQRTILKVREKRLQADLWRCAGQEQKGSHFPICAFTNKVGRRSKEKMVERSRKPGGIRRSRSMMHLLNTPRFSTSGRTGVMAAGRAVRQGMTSVARYSTSTCCGRARARHGDAGSGTLGARTVMRDSVQKESWKTRVAPELSVVAFSNS